MFRRLLFRACSGIFLCFPLFNRHRLRVGDLLAGTWVVHLMRSTLGRDLVAAQINRERWPFSDDALDLYGIYELQTLEDVLRRGETGAISTVATSIRHKAGLPDPRADSAFLFESSPHLVQRKGAL